MRDGERQRRIVTKVNGGYCWLQTETKYGASAPTRVLIRNGKPRGHRLISTFTPADAGEEEERGLVGELARAYDLNAVTQSEEFAVAAEELIKASFTGDLTGSEKQIQWADDIRQREAEHLCRLVSSHLRHPVGDRNQLGTKLKFRVEIVRAFAEREYSASAWIEARDNPLVAALESARLPSAEIRAIASAAGYTDEQIAASPFAT